MVHNSGYEDVYGLTFADYSNQQFSDFLAPLEYRITSNGLNPSDLFRGKRVLDAGCGGGRGSVLAAKYGASHVTSIDVSKTNCLTTKYRLEHLGVSEFESVVLNCDLEHLPCASGDYDFIWFNGVLQHTERPSRVMREILRVLRSGGQGWLYLYGRGGVYWKVIATFRQAFSKLTVQEIVCELKKIGLDANRIAEIVDDWKTPYLRVYGATEFESAIESMGFTLDRLMLGVAYDTSELLSRGFSNELVGDGDLRYIFTKKHDDVTTSQSQAAKLLDESHLHCEEQATFDPDKLNGLTALDSSLLAFLRIAEFDPIRQVEVAANTQLRLRDEFLLSPSTELAVECISSLNMVH